MKRSPWFVLGGAVAGFAGVLGFHNGAAHPVASPVTPSPSQATATPGGRAAASRGPHGGRATAGTRSHPGGISGSSRGATGPTEQFGYGSIAVRVTVEDSRITEVTVAGLQTLEPTSQQISSQAIPVLQSEVLSAQSATVDGVTGATYTSQGYERSLQAALDRLHAG